MRNPKHGLKTSPEFFGPVQSGLKNFELRKNDRDFKVGDLLLLREFHPAQGYTGRDCLREITYITAFPEALRPGYVALGLQAVEE